MIGQLIGRVLGILAVDHAIQALPKHGPLRCQTPITGNAYYNALLSDDAWEKLGLSVPVNHRKLCEKLPTCTFEDAFCQCTSPFFPHYAKANDDTSFKDQHTRPLWLRGAAVLGRLNQQITDRGLPIHHTWAFWLRGTAVLGQLNQQMTALQAHQGITVATPSTYPVTDPEDNSEAPRRGSDVYRTVQLSPRSCRHYSERR
jgi:hypothetical protein